MTERINHAAQARRVLSNAPHEFIQDTGIALAWAQVHATLALVEQQRIANLIAATALNFRDADFTKPWNGDGDTPEWRAVRDRIAEGLGL